MAKQRYFGKKTRTGVFKCRFVNIYEKDDKGKYSIELLVPKKEAIELNKKLYSGNQKLVDFMKPRKTSKVPKPLYGDVYKWDEENECVMIDVDEETGEEFKVVDEELKVFRFKTAFPVKVQFKKGLDTTARIGWGSEIAISTRVFASIAEDENGGQVKYASLNLDAIRVYELVTSEREEDWEDGDDEFEDSDVEITGEEEDDNSNGSDADNEEDEFEDAEEVKPKKGKAKKPSKTEKDF